MTDPTSLAQIAERGPDARINPRTNMFLGAALYGDGFSSPVKVRNMSASGALVEGGAIPESGAGVRLVRGSLCVPAQVIWSVKGRCGLRFVALVTVGDWLAPPRNTEQQRVDEVVSLVKAGAVPIAPTQRSTLEPANLGDELRRICILLEKIGDTLSSDEVTLAKHGSELQNLDICTQTIAAVSDALEGKNALSADRLASLRLSCEQALRACPSSP